MNKELEEMIKIIDKDEFYGLAEKTPKLIAEELYKAGYRKLPIMENLDTKANARLLSERFEMFTPDRVFVKKNLLYGIVYYVDKQAIARKGYIYAAALNAFLGIDTNEVKKWIKK